MSKQQKPAVNKPVPAKPKLVPKTRLSQRISPSKPENSQKRSSNIPRIVGIGASAGGLEALELFLAHMPAGNGLAFVIIQHLAPTHKGIMPELLQRITPMPVFQASNHLKIKPNCVYVIPPNKDLSILRGVLHLLDPIASRGLRLPIDYFFRALAEDRRELAISVILSGMGSDGTLGLRAIKEKGGMALVQEPASAKFDSMPRSAIDAGLADIVAPAEKLPDRIIAYLKHTPHILSDEPILATKSRSALEKIMILLRERTGNDFSLYKKNTLYRRIERRIGLHQIDNISTYVRYLQENAQELDLLFKELLIGVTSFFRDPEVWEYLKTTALPALLAAYPAGKVLRAWVPACSSGEEAYSLAIVFKEALEQIKSKKISQGRFSLQIFATDLDTDAIDQARQAFYPANIAANVAPQRLERFFSKEENGYRVSKEIRGMVIFAPQNIITDPPFIKLDILSCRNLLIYVGPELQKRLIPLFHYALRPAGILLLGTAESIGNAADLFTPLESKMRFYRCIDNPLRAVDFQSRYAVTTLSAAEETGAGAAAAPSPANLQSLADQLLLQNYSPAAVLVNAEGDIFYIRGRTGKYLEPAAGKANWNIYAMAREGLRHELASAMLKAARQQSTVSVAGLEVAADGGTQTVNLTVQSIDQPEALHRMLLIVFTDVAAPLTGSVPHKAPNTKTRALLTELQHARKEARTMHEEMQTSQEELKSTNEELQSTNEELQSTNEELTTSKEEMQSFNEELQTVIAELQSKVDNLSTILSTINNDMQNLLNSTETLVVFLNNTLHVRRFTPQVTALFKLKPGDVGRPLTDIVTDLDYPELLQDAQIVLQTMVFSEKTITTRDGRWFKVRIMPYRTQDNLIDGVVITFINITESKLLEAKLREIRSQVPQEGET